MLRSSITTVKIYLLQIYSAINKSTYISYIQTIQYFTKLVKYCQRRRRNLPSIKQRCSWIDKWNHNTQHNHDNIFHHRHPILDPWPSAPGLRPLATDHRSLALSLRHWVPDLWPQQIKLHQAWLNNQLGSARLQSPRPRPLASALGLNASALGLRSLIVGLQPQYSTTDHLCIVSRLSSLDSYE